MGLRSPSRERLAGSHYPQTPGEDGLVSHGMMSPALAAGRVPSSPAHPGRQVDAGSGGGHLPGSLWNQVLAFRFLPGGELQHFSLHERSR